MIDACNIQRLVCGEGACYASDMITVRGMKVGYMYRELPETTADSGWRFLAGCESQEYVDDPNHFEIYDVNTICNYDPEIISFLDSDPGSAFERAVDGFVKIDEHS